MKTRKLGDLRQSLPWALFSSQSQCQKLPAVFDRQNPRPVCCSDERRLLPVGFGFFLFIVGCVINWPTLITLTMAPLLLGRYYQLAIEEEQYMLDQSGEQCAEYMDRTGRFWPRFARPVKS